MIIDALFETLWGQFLLSFLYILWWKSMFLCIIIILFSTLVNEAYQCLDVVSSSPFCCKLDKVVLIDGKKSLLLIVWYAYCLNKNIKRMEIGNTGTLLDI